MNRSYLMFLLLFAASTTMFGCNGEDCTPTPTAKKFEEKSKEIIDDLLDSADAYERQKKRAHEMLYASRPERKKVRATHEKLRAKLLAELLAEKPNKKKFIKTVDTLAIAYGAYTNYVVAKVFEAHAMFTDEQRVEIGKTIDKDPEEVGTFLINRGIEYAMFKIDATDAQETLVWKERDHVVKLANTLMRSQNKIRKVLIKEWNSKEPDTKKVDLNVAKGAKQIQTFIHKFADSAFKVLDTLTPEQRIYTDSQVSRMKRCVETASLLPSKS